MSVRPWLPWYPSDWLGSGRARLLTSAQRGIYVDLLCHHWDMETLPANAEACVRLCAWDATVPDVALVLEVFFVPVVGGWQNRKMAKLRAGADALHEVRSAAGAAGGKQCASKRQANAKQSDQQTPSKPEANAKHARAVPQPQPSPQPEPQSQPEPKLPEAATQPLVGLTPDGSPDPQPVAQPSRTSRSDVQAVVDHYRAAHPQARPGAKERALIAARLREGYPVADLCRSIDGFHRSPWHTGENPGNKIYLSLKLLMRDSSQVAAGLEHASGSGRNGAGMTEREMRSQRAGDEWLAEMAARDNPEDVTYEVH